MGINEQTVVNLKDTSICKNVELISISAYCMQLIYTGEVRGLPKHASREIMEGLIDNIKYDESIKKLARNLIGNTFMTNSVGETLLQSKENIDFVTNNDTIKRLYSLLNEIGFYNMKETISKYEEFVAKSLKLRYKRINGAKLSVAELREIYTNAVMKNAGVKIDFYTVNEGNAYNKQRQFGNSKNKIIDFLEALYSISTGREMPEDALYENLEDGIKFGSQAIEIVEYRLRLIEKTECTFISAAVNKDILEIERLFNFK